MSLITRWNVCAMFLSPNTSREILKGQWCCYGGLRYVGFGNRYLLVSSAYIQLGRENSTCHV